MKFTLILCTAVLSSVLFLNRSNIIETNLNNYSDTTRSVQSGQNQYIPHVMDTGIGPVKSLNLGVVDFLQAEYGKRIYSIRKCGSCHNSKDSMKAPKLRNITQVRTPEFIMNYLLNMKEMQGKDSDVKRSIKIYNKKMPVQHLSRRQARALLEYFRLLVINKNYK